MPTHTPLERKKNRVVKKKNKMVKTKIKKGIDKASLVIKRLLVLHKALHQK